MLLLSLSLDKRMVMFQLAGSYCSVPENFQGTFNVEVVGARPWSISSRLSSTPAEECGTWEIPKVRGPSINAQKVRLLFGSSCLGSQSLYEAC